MLGKTHRMTGLALYAGLIAQSTPMVHKFNQDHLLPKVFDDAISQPILKFMNLTQLTNHSASGSDLAQYTLMILIYGIIIYYGLVLPDVDSKNSTLGRYVPFIEDVVGHRTIFHSIIPIILLVIGSIFTSGFLQIVLTLITVSYTFHLIEDSYSIQGINWIVVPLKHKWSKFRYRVDGPFEKVVFIISIIVFFGLIVLIAFASGIATHLPELVNL